MGSQSPRTFSSSMPAAPARLSERRGVSPIVAVVVASLLGVSGVVVINHYAGTPVAAEQDYFELYLTDAPAKLDALVVALDAAYVGTADHPLALETPVFDLLAHRGPGEAIRVARGFVPTEYMGEVTLVFKRVEGVSSGKRVPIQLPEQRLTIEQGLSVGAGQDGAVLLDLDVEKSLQDRAGALSFEPVVSHLYEVPLMAEPAPDVFGTAAPIPTDAWMAAAAVEAPEQIRHVVSAASAAAGLPSADVEAAVEAFFEETLADVIPEPPEQLVPEDPVHVSDAGLHHYIVQFDSEEARNEVASLMPTLGGEVTYSFRNYPALSVALRADGVEQLRDLEGVSYVEDGEIPIEFHSFESAKTAIGWHRLQEGGSLFGMVDSKALPYDGSGIGVAIIDSGVDGNHPDLKFDLLGTKPPDAVLLENYKQVSLAAVRVPNSDTSMGHGTMVAGVIAGQASQLGASVGGDAAQVGLAPGARLYSWGVGDGGQMLWAVQAYDDLLFMVRGDRFDPPIRILQNSWSAGTVYDPNALISHLVADVVDEGILTVFSAGNSGGDGSVNLVNALCQVPRKGILCVAGYEDSDTGTTAGTIYGAGSRGLRTNEATWPDLVAPATRITSTRALATAGSLDAKALYGTMSGTSIAAPMVSAAAALVLQANPKLTPEVVECHLKATAIEFVAGGAYSTSGGHYAKGHGLLNIEDAVKNASLASC